MKKNLYRYSKVVVLFFLLLLAFSTNTYAKTPSKKKVHKAYVKYIKENYMPYYKTGRRKKEKTKYGTLEYEYYDLKAKEIDVNKDGIKELIIGSYTGGARGSYSLFLYRKGKVIDARQGGTGGVFVYKKKIYFAWSNGAADGGWTKVKIKNKSKGITATTYESIYNDANNSIRYTINNRVVSAKKFKKSLSLPSNSISRMIKFKLTDIETYIR